MSEKIAIELFSESQQLERQLDEAGWVISDDNSLSSRSPVDLFLTEERPLVVGLFGGTGVGKSSLLNRLAGADIARTGVVRPTSMEITCYLHQDVRLDALPDHFAADRFSENRHNNDDLADVMWVDMPDFDSDETQNKDQVLRWLPHIDLLIYVVTPERYKDAEGWRMMLANGYQHAWLFVINQWDKAQPVQYNDFVRMLESTGFQSPEVFRTVCNGDHSDDQLDELVNVIASLAKRNVIIHLQERGWVQRLAAMQAKLNANSKMLADSGPLSLSQSFKNRWQTFSQSAIAHLDAPFKTHGALFAEEKTNPVAGVFKSFGGSEARTRIANNIAARSDVGELWDDWLSVRLHDSIQQFELADDEHVVPATALSLTDDIAAVDPAGIVTRHLKQSVEATIQSPGTMAQRVISTCASILKFLLPLLALGWIAWRVISGFVEGAEDRSAYVGFDFLVNGIILAGLGWLIPMVIEKMLVPSMPDSIYRGLHGGLQNALDEIEQTVVPSVTQVQADKEHYLAQVNDLEQKIEQVAATLAKTADPALDRVLMAPADKSN